MIRNTFIFVPGIGTKTEEYFRKKGILTWHDFRKKMDTTNLGMNKRNIVKDYLKRAENALHTRNGSFFAKLLPQREYWRLYREFLHKTLFLDIETTGLSLYYDKITLVGTFDGYSIKLFVKDNNLEEVVDYLRNYEVVITFNGKLFDVPFIKKEFPCAEIPPIHIDLRWVLRNLGVTGPLKEIEKKLNVQRPKPIQEIGGREATVLWHRFVRGDDEALEKLLLYNIYDLVNLQVIMHLCYHEKIKAFAPKIPDDTFDTQRLVSRGTPYLDGLPNFGPPVITTHYFGNGLLEVYLNDALLLRIDRKKTKGIEIKMDRLIREIKNKNLSLVSVGIDLSGSEKRNSGFCVLQGKEAYLDIVKTNKEIISRVMSIKPTVISIDSPLSLPTGRCCTDDSCECRKYGITRECERILKKRGINVYPCLIKSMQQLTMRGIKLARLFKEQGYAVIESYPGAAQDLLNMPRKRIDLKELESNLKNVGIRFFSKREPITHDELDGLTSALVGYFYLAGSYEALGNMDEGYLIIPALNKKNKKN